MRKKAGEVPERDRLLGLIAEVILEQGVTEITLSGLARTIGSNNKMVLYYFGSKEGAITEEILHAYPRFPLLYFLMTNLLGHGTLDERFGRTWVELRQPENLPFIRLFLEVYGLASHNPGAYEKFIASTVGAWPPAMVAALRSQGYSATDADLLTEQITALWIGLQFRLI